MRCVCGYEYKQGIDFDGDQKYKLLKGDEPFIEYERKHIKGKHDHGNETTEYIVCICPKCGNMCAEEVY